MFTMLWLWCSAGWAGRASEIPLLASLLGEAGWLPTPALSGGFRPGFVFQVDANGHRLQLGDCFTAQATAADVPAELVKQLQAGVQVDGGALVEKVSFGAPAHWSIPAPALVPSPACLDTLLSAWSQGLDLRTLYVVREVLVAGVAERTCGRRDAKGRFVELKPEEAARIPACGQRSLEPVEVGYRTTPVMSLPGLFEPQPASVAASSVHAPAGDTITLDRFVSALEAPPDERYGQLSQMKRMEAIERLKELLSKGPADDTLAEMMLRLADLYFQEARYLHHKAHGDTPPDAIEWLEQASRLYEGILRNHPRYQRLDQATYYLGRSLRDLGREAEALEHFKQLIKLYPESEYVPESYVYIGEHYFHVDKNAFGALKGYLKASSYPEGSLQGYVLYQLSWSYAEVGERDKAVEALQALVAYLNQAEAGEPYLSLRAAARDALTRF